MKITNLFFKFIPSINPVDTIQYISKMQIPIDNFAQLSIENKLYLTYLSYYARKIFHTIGISQQFILHVIEEIEWTELDYFNAILFIAAVYSFYKNIESKEKIDKISLYINKKQAKNLCIILFVIFTVLFRDTENAT